MNQSICIGCSHTISTPVRRLSAHTLDLLYKICFDRNDVICRARYHGIEFCIFCYANEPKVIEAQFIFKERVEVETRRLLGFGKGKLEEMRKTLRREWRREMRSLDVEWEGM